MQVIVCHTYCPAVFDSSDRVAEEFGKALRRRGHEVEDIPMPFDPAFSPLEQILAFRLFGPVDHGDILVALNPPCHVTGHRRKLIWGVDRGIRSEDLMPPDYFTPDGASRTVLESLRVSDRLALAEASRTCLRSRAACERHFQETGARAEFLPLPPRRVASSAGFEPILAARTKGSEPALLLTALEGLARSPAPVRLALFGPPPFSATQWSELLSLHGLEGRIELREACDWPGAMPSILAVLGLSLDADSLGLDTIDAHGCEKPVITFDSAAAAEWVMDGVNGLAVKFDPQALGQAVSDLAANRTRAHDLGLAGKSQLKSWGADWDHAVETLIEV